MTKFVNMTPHVVRIADGDGNIIQELPSAGILRLAASRKLIDVVDGIPVSRSRMSVPEDLPKPGPEEYFIVSTPAAVAIKDPRYISPDTGYTAIRENGKIIAVRGFVTF